MPSLYAVEMIEKPKWLLYASEARKQLDNVKPSKGGKREDAFILNSWKRACTEFGYQGGEGDWRYLLRKL